MIDKYVGWTGRASGFGMATAMRRIGPPAQAHRAILEAMKKDKESCQSKTLPISSLKP
jgi:hypothetical protein